MYSPRTLPCGRLARLEHCDGRGPWPLADAVHEDQTGGDYESPGSLHARAGMDAIHEGPTVGQIRPARARRGPGRMQSLRALPWGRAALLAPGEGLGGCNC